MKFHQEKVCGLARVGDRLDATSFFSITCSSESVWSSSPGVAVTSAWISDKSPLTCTEQWPFLCVTVCWQVNVGGSLGSGKLACAYFGALWWWWAKNERVETLPAAGVWISYFCTIYLQSQQAWEVIFVFCPGSLISWGCWELWYWAAFPCSLLLSCWIQSLQPPSPLSAVYGHIWSVSLHTCWWEPPPCWHTRHGFWGLWRYSHPSQHLFFHERERERRAMGRAVAGKAPDTKFPGTGFAHFMTVQMEMQWSWIIPT